MRADERKKVVNKEFTEKRTTRTQSSETGVRLCFRLPVSLEFVDNYTPNGFSPQRYHMPVMQATEGNPSGRISSDIQPSGITGRARPAAIGTSPLEIVFHIPSCSIPDFLTKITNNVVLPSNRYYPSCSSFRFHLQDSVIISAQSSEIYFKSLTFVNHKAIGMEKGVVIKSTGNNYLVRKENGEFAECRIRGKFRLQGFRTTNPIAVGDRVEFEKSNEGYVITHIEERHNYIIRKSTNLSKESHIIASNVDQALLIATINYPETSTVFIDRFLATTEAYNIPALILFNKADLYQEEDRMKLNYYTDIYTRIGYTCLTVSAVTGENINVLKRILKDKTSVFSGISGVGKSTLINYIEPGLHLKTAFISEAHNAGKHTTTFAEMFPLTKGGFIIDTPGLRSFGMIDMKKEEISHFFPEIFRTSAKCRFYNCTHIHEPGCAVIEALQNGEISDSRYWSYLSMMEESGEKYR